MNKIAKIKNEVNLKQWAEMVRQRNESGLSVSQWCLENIVVSLPDDFNADTLKRLLELLR